MRVEDQFLYLYFLLRSPVMNGSVNAWLVHLSGYVSIDGVYGSYGCICSTDYSKFFQHYWWLRSPTTDPIYVYGAYYVTPDGDVGLGGYSVPGDNGYYNIGRSYGRKIAGTGLLQRCVLRVPGW